MTKGRSVPVTTTRIWSGIFCHSACVASTCSTSEVPIPKAMAPNAPSVPVWESPQTTVIPGWTSPDSGPMMWTIPCRGSSMSNRAIPAPRAFSRKAWICSRLPRSSIRTERSGVVGTLWSGTASIAPGRRTDRPAGRKTRERLGARHLVHQVPVDVQEDVVPPRRHDVTVPDLFEQRRHGSPFPRVRGPGNKWKNNKAATKW